MNRITTVLFFLLLKISSAHGQVFECFNNEQLVWPIRLGNPPYEEYATPEAMCVNWPNSGVGGIEYWHGPGWVYHSTNVNEFRSGANCLYTNPGRGIQQPRELNAGANPQCIPGPRKDCDSGENTRGNPCNVATGAKVQSELDISVGGLTFKRFYNSNNAVTDTGIGRGWIHNFQRAIRVARGGNSLLVVSVSGRGERWNKAAGVWRGDNDSDLSLTQQNDAPFGFTITKSNGSIEKYDVDGLMTETIDSNGHSTTLNYDLDRQLMSVTNQYGQSLSFTYESQRISTVTDSTGKVFSYEYDGLGNLVGAILPDLTPNDDTDNASRVYHYEDSSYPYHLTGITDENGNRYARYAYDANGKAISTEHAPTTNPVGQERFELDY